MYRRFLIIVGAVFLFVDPLTTARALDAQQISARAETGSLVAELADASPICDHFPAAPGEPPGSHTYLLATLKLTNHTGQSLRVEIAESSISFAVSIMDESGVATGRTAITVPSLGRVD